jgi:hypothetical protein
MRVRVSDLAQRKSVAHTRDLTGMHPCTTQSTNEPLACCVRECILWLLDRWHPIHLDFLPGPGP